MIIKKCTDISKKTLHKLSLDAYNDYLLDVSMDYDTFYNHFINDSDIDLSHSFVAIIDDVPAGFILGSINNYENIKTLRCAAFAVINDYRNQKVGLQLFKRHLEAGIENNCSRLFLEVIKENKAKSFYLREGYQILDELFYYSLAINKYTFENGKSIDFKPLTNDKMNDYLIDHNVHINYQNHPVILKKSEENKYYELMHQGKSVGAISYDTAGILSIMYIKEPYRKIDYLNSVFHYLKSKENFDTIKLSVTSEMNYIPLFKAIGFKKEPIEQFEMVKNI